MPCLRNAIFRKFDISRVAGCVHVHAYAFICMHMHSYACICKRMHAYASICMHIQANTIACVCMHMYAYACICMYMHAYACICLHMQVARLECCSCCSQCMCWKSCFLTGFQSPGPGDHTMVGGEGEGYNPQPYIYIYRDRCFLFVLLNDLIMGVPLSKRGTLGEKRQGPWLQTENNTH